MDESRLDHVIALFEQALSVLECDACGERREIGGDNDPLRATFRDYT